MNQYCRYNFRTSASYSNACEHSGIWYFMEIFDYFHQKVRLKILHRIFCLSNREIIRKLPLQKTVRTDPQAKSLSVMSAKI